MDDYREDWDGAWKHVLEHHLEALLEWALPQLHCQIDWSHGQEQLNTELLLARENLGRRSYVDCLVRLVEKESGRQAAGAAEA